MESVVLVIHVILAVSLVLLVLLQRSEGGGLGIGQGGGMGGFASPRGTANFLTRATAICAGLFFVTSLVLGIMAGSHHRQNVGILQGMPSPASETMPLAPSPAAPVQPASPDQTDSKESSKPSPKPSAPLSKPNSE